jgi:Protein of unknown function (DUF3160)
MRLNFYFLFFCLTLISFANAQSGKNQVENFQFVQPLTPNQRALLEKNGLIATPSQFDQIYQVYQYASKQNMPIYVTADAILHTFHLLFDYSLRVTELEYFYPALENLTQGLLNYELVKLKSAKLTNVKGALKKNIAYLSVAAALLDDKFKIPASVEKSVEAELKLIQEHQGIAQSVIFNYKEDYSQYVPRGHYTRNEKFERYFKAMMWFGRISFYLKPGNKKSDLDLGRALTRQAILLVDALQNCRVSNESAQKIWEQIYNPLTFLIGKTDDLNYYDYLKLITQLYPKKDLYKKIEPDENIDKFIAAAQSLPAPKTLSTYYLKTDTTSPIQATRSFRFLGQRYIPDSYIFQQLVYDKVGNNQKPRYLPKGLDVMAALGSNRALEILKTVYKENQYFNYDTQMLKLKTEFKELTTPEWNQSVYFGWLHTLKLLLEPISKSPNLPDFLFSPAYADKTLVTVCGSWTQLRHDTILYAKQSYTVALTAIRPQANQPGYVEPYPKVYEQMTNLISDLENILKQYLILDDEVGSRLENLKTLTQKLNSIADKEVKGNELDDDDLTLLNHIGDNLEGMITFPGQFDKYSSETDNKMALVADVHTDPNSMQVLEEGVGNPYFIYAVIPYLKKQFLAVGGVFSYYEFTKPISERMTDEEWQKLEPKPDLPVWTNSFIMK